MEKLTEDKLRAIFKEIADQKRQVITFKDFKQSIVHFRIELMKGLKPSDPDFHEYCKELFQTIC